MKDVTHTAGRSGSGHRGRLVTMGATALATAALAVGACAAGTAAHAATTHATVTAAKSLASGYKPPKRDLSVGSTGSDVKALQERLSALKYYPGAIDGHFGGDTQAALWAFQEINLIPETGVDRKSV